MDRYKFGEFIYQKRKSLGLTQEELGRKVGVTNKAVSKWEVGETLPDVMMLEPLAQVLQITVDELLTHTDKKEVEKKNVKINKVFLFIIIGLVIIEILTVVLFLSLYNPTDEKEIERLKFTEDTFNEIVTMNPLKNITCIDQQIVIDSVYYLNSDYCLENEENELTFVVSYRYNYYYYRNDGTLGVVTYYNRTIDVSLSNLDNTSKISITLEPQVKIENFNGFKSIEIDYSIYGCTGEVIQKEVTVGN